MALGSMPCFLPDGSFKPLPLNLSMRKAIASKPFPPWAKPVWVRKPTKALFICTLAGSSGPSELTAPFEPCAEMVPGPLEMMSPRSIENSNLSLSVGFLPMRARKDASVNDHSSMSSLVFTPQKLSFLCLAEGALQPTNDENIREYQGSAAMVIFGMLLFMSGSHPRGIHMAARMASLEGLPFVASLTNSMNTDFLPRPSTLFNRGFASASPLSAGSDFFASAAGAFSR